MATERVSGEANGGTRAVGSGGETANANAGVVAEAVGLAQSIDAAVQSAPQARRLIAIFSYLGSRRIPLDIVTADVMTPADRDAAVSALETAGLVRRGEESGFAAVDVDAGVQKAMRSLLSEAGDDASIAQLATRLVSEAYPHGSRDPGDADSWTACQRLEDHVRAVLQFAPDEGEGADATSQLLHQYAQYLFARGKLEDAEEVMRRGGAIAEAMLGPAHPRVGQDSADLAVLLYESGRIEEALPFVRRALSIDEAAFGPEHPVVADRYNMMATLLETLNRPAEADPYIRHALLVAEKTLGADHPDTRLYRENYDKVIAAMDAVARQDDAVEAGEAPASPERLARPDIPPPPVPGQKKAGLMGRFRGKR